LAPVLIKLDRDEEARNLLKRYKEDIFAVWCYTKALLDFRKHGDSPASRKALKKAIRTNGYVADYLVKDYEYFIPDGYSPGSREEAIHCTLLLQEVWEETDGAIDWLESMA